jgi:hypothetical protein
VAAASLAAEAAAWQKRNFSGSSSRFGSAVAAWWWRRQQRCIDGGSYIFNIHTEIPNGTNKLNHVKRLAVFQKKAFGIPYGRMNHLCHNWNKCMLTIIQNSSTAAAASLAAELAAWQKRNFSGSSSTFESAVAAWWQQRQHRCVGGGLYMFNIHTKIPNDTNKLNHVKRLAVFQNKPFGISYGRMNPLCHDWNKHILTIVCNTLCNRCV